MLLGLGLTLPCEDILVERFFCGGGLSRVNPGLYVGGAICGRIGVGWEGFGWGEGEEGLAGAGFGWVFGGEHGDFAGFGFYK